MAVHNEDPSQTSTKRTTPEVDFQLLKDLKTTIRAFNDDKVKGRLSPTFEEAMKLLISVLFLRSPMRLKHFEDHVDLETAEVSDPDAYRRRIAGYIEHCHESIEESAQMLESGVQPSIGDPELARVTNDSLDHIPPGATNGSAGNNAVETAITIAQTLSDDQLTEDQTLEIARIGHRTGRSLGEADIKQIHRVVHGRDLDDVSDGTTLR